MGDWNRTIAGQAATAQAKRIQELQKQNAELRNAVVDAKNALIEAVRYDVDHDHDCEGFGEQKGIFELSLCDCSLWPLLRLLRLAKKLEAERGRVE